MTQAVVNTPVVAPDPATSIRETEFWIAGNVRPEYPAGGRLAKIDFPLSLPVDAPVTIMGTVFQIRSVALIVTADRAVLVYGLR